VGIVGADAAAVALSELLAAVGVESGGLVEDRRRPTTEKVRVVTERTSRWRGSTTSGRRRGPATSSERSWIAAAAGARRQSVARV